MPANGFSIGKDVSVTVVTSYGTLTFSGLTDFMADPEVTKLKSKGLDGNTRHGIVPDCWKGSFKLDRVDPTVDNYWAQVEADYYAGKSSLPGTILETVAEADGTTTQWRYDGVVLTLEKAGDWSADKKVDQAIAFEASHKTKVS